VHFLFCSASSYLYFILGFINYMYSWEKRKQRCISLLKRGNRCLNGRRAASASCGSTWISSLELQPSLPFQQGMSASASSALYMKSRIQFFYCSNCVHSSLILSLPRLTPFSWVSITRDRGGETSPFQRLREKRSSSEMNIVFISFSSVYSSSSPVKTLFLLYFATYFLSSLTW